METEQSRFIAVLKLTEENDRLKARVELLEEALEPALGLTTLCSDLLIAIREKDVAWVNATMTCITSVDTLLEKAFKIEND
jgi:hypothetical protein